MARLTPDQWQEARADYEIRLLSFEQIAKKFLINKSSISRKAQADGWNREKMQQLIEKKANAINELKSVTQQTQQMPIETQRVFIEVADIRAKIKEGDECSAEIYRITRKKGLSLVKDEDADLSEVMRLMTVGNEAVKTTIKMIELSDKTQDTSEQNENKSLTIELVNVKRNS